MFFRSNGEVRFVKLSPRVQIAATVAALAGAGWLAVVSVDFLMEDRVLAAREQKIRDMAVAYDKLTGEMGGLQQDIVSRTDQLERRQHLLEQMVEDGLATPAEGDDGIVPVETDAPEMGNEAAVREPRPSLFGSLFRAHAAVDGDIRYPRPTDDLRQEIDARLTATDEGQRALAHRLLDATQRELADIDANLSDTGLTSELILSHWNGDGSATGGPFVADGSLDAIFTGSDDDPLYLLHDNRRKLDSVRSALMSFPTAKPVDNYYISSYFGRRKDPFRRVWAMHHGLDMAGWPGSAINATADGVVTRAGTWGAYGRMVEIDHGNGFKTRYGHMKRVRVKRGQQISRGQRVGDMGRTGRSTGTHLHYEIWFGGKPRNPLPFLKAAEYVLKIQGRSQDG